MKVKLLGVMAGPDRILQPGTIIDLAPAIAAHLVESRQAVMVEEAETVKTGGILARFGRNTSNAPELEITDKILGTVPADIDAPIGTITKE